MDVIIGGIEGYLLHCILKTEYKYCCATKYLLLKAFIRLDRMAGVV